MTIPEIIKRVQARVGEDQDGIAGIRTWTAIAKAVGANMTEAVQTPTEPEKPYGGAVDARSETNLATLHPQVQPKARELIQLAAITGMNFKITSALRSYAEQDELYAQGRTKPGDIVTNARGGFSSHQFGIAWDVTKFDGDKPVWDSDDYLRLADLGSSHLGLSCGAFWTKPDEPHYYLKPKWATLMTESEMMAELRRRHDNGIDVFA